MGSPRRPRFLRRPLLARLAAAQAGRHRLVARLETRHAGQEFLDPVLVELHAGVGIFHRYDRPQTVGGFNNSGTDLEPLHHGLLRRQPPRRPPETSAYQTFTSVVKAREVEYTFVPCGTNGVHLIGVSLDLGGNRRGVDMGPSAFRIAGLAERLTALGFTVVDDGDLVAPIPEVKSLGDPNKKYIREIARVCERLYKTSLAALEKGALPLVLGGDHSLGAGSVAATAEFAPSRGQAARPDLGRRARRHEHAGETTSGNVHGMPLASLLGPEPAELSRIGGFSPKVLPEHTVLIGIRNLDEREKEIVRASGVHVFTMKDIDRSGIASVVERALALAGAGTGGIHVSFDLDVCDPAIAPGVGTPVKGGLDYREAHMVMEMIADSGLLRALDLVEVNPILDDRNMTAILGVELASSALGQKII